jgi:hypothetical protein
VKGNGKMHQRGARGEEKRVGGAGGKLETVRRLDSKALTQGDWILEFGAKNDVERRNAERQ